MATSKLMHVHTDCPCGEEVTVNAGVVRAYCKKCGRTLDVEAVLAETLRNASAEIEVARTIGFKPAELKAAIDAGSVLPD